jgi:hypothetical protein
MISWIKFEWIFISWVLSLFLHHHSVKRTAISAQKDALLDLISSLSEFKWLDEQDGALYQEERYNAKLSRITWKLKQLNQLASCNLIEENKLTTLYKFDVECYISDETFPCVKSKLKFELQECCEDIIDKIENAHFDKIISSKIYIVWSVRHSLFGIFFGLAIVYMFIEIMKFFFK